jgi:hypothetical protein
MERVRFPILAEQLLQAAMQETVRLASAATGSNNGASRTTK